MTAEVVEVDDEASEAGEELTARAIGSFRALAALAGAEAPEPDESSPQLSFELAAQVELAADAKQQLLESRLEAERLDLVAELLDDARVALLQSVELGERAKRNGSRAHRSSLPDFSQVAVVAGTTAARMNPGCRASAAAAGVVLGGELREELVQRPAFLGGEGREELPLDALRDRAQLVEAALAVGRQPDEVAAAVVLVALTLGEAALLELVEDPDELAAVVAERVGDLACVSRAPSSSRERTP